MDNENKELELDNQEVVSVVPDEEFDPTLSDEFYNNLEDAIGEEVQVPEEELPELVLEDSLFAVVEDEASQEPVSAMEEELFAGVDAALTEQIEQEFGRVEEVSSAEEEEPSKFVAGWRAIPTWTKVLVSVILVVLVSVGLLFGTVGGRTLIYNTIVGIVFDNWFTKEDPEQTVTPAPGTVTITVTPEPTQDPNVGTTITPEPTQDPNAETTITPEPTEDPQATLTPTPTPQPFISVMDDPDVINILLIGEENMHNATNGRADAIVLVSVNLNGGNLKMVSFQRDLYVQIPGKWDDKLNAAYAYGSASLLVETMEKNFGVDIDAYAKVNFAGFENIIDELGGLKISLTAAESEYLNTTKYISKEEERNTVAGMQTLTGAQVLGYCRVRYIDTLDGLKNDTGRNYRHRVVLKAIFDQYAPKSLVDLAAVLTKMQTMKGYVTVSSNLEGLAQDCLRTVVENKMFNIDTLQIPKAGLWKDSNIGGKDVISYFPENIDILQEFLYGEE